MKLLRLKLPEIKNSRKLYNEEKESSFIKLTIHNQSKTTKLVRIPKNVRTINYNNYLSQRESFSKLENSKDINASIKSFLLKNISTKNNLSPKYNLKKITSPKYFNQIQYINKNKEKIFNRKNRSNTNVMDGLLFNLQKISGTKTELKRVNNINKYLFRDNENPTNGNKLYNDTEEEKKESLTFFFDKNNMKNMLKKNLTKKINIKKNILNIQPKFLDKFHIQSSSFTPFGYNNIRRIKYLENMAQEKLKNNFSTPKKIDYFNYESKREKFKTVLRKKMKDLGQEMIDNKETMKNINKRIESCLKKARSELEVFAESIEKENKLE